MTEPVTERDILDAIREAMAGAPDSEPGTITTAEAAEALGYSPKTTLKKLHRLRKRGLLAPAYIKRTNVWDERISVKGWRYVGE